jgi:hypothetical protein
VQHVNFGVAGTELDCGLNNFFRGCLGYAHEHLLVHHLSQPSLYFADLKFSIAFV